jgi:phospholipase C
MSACTKTIDRLVIGVQNWATGVAQNCSSQSDDAQKVCTQKKDEGYNQCTQTKDEGYNQCSQQQQQSESSCSGWGIFSFICTAWTTIVSWVCVAWTWISNIVCVVWTWISNIVCVAWTWVVNALCQVFAWLIKTIAAVFSWVAIAVCVVLTAIKCVVVSIGNLLSNLLGERRNAPKIEHVFVLMLENRAFDHMFGLSGITGVDIQGNPTSINGANPALNTNIDPTTMLPVGVSTPADFQLKGIDVDPGHEFPDVLTCLGGAGAVYNPVPGGYPPINNSGFIQNYLNSGSSLPSRIMRCFDPAQLPVLNALAGEFTLCDNWFSSLPGPTWPNRFFLLAATSGGLDGSPSTLDIIQATTVEGYRFENGNVFDLLDANCIDWRIYEGDDFPISFALSGMDLNYVEGKFSHFDGFASDVSQAGFSERFIFIEPKYGAHEFDITGPGDFTCGNSMHPLDDVTRGEALVKQVYEAIRNSPCWETSVLLITFDEHGGFYDHVAPPAAVPPGDLINQSYVQNHFQFDQLGVRVPAIVVSPFTKKGVIDHTLYDHTSMLKTLESLFGMQNLTNRDKAANDFLHLLNLNTARTDPPTTLPSPAVNPNPLQCEADDQDKLMGRRSELRSARQAGTFRGVNTAEIPLKPSQVGFLQVALLKVLRQVDLLDRAQWIEDYKRIATGVDAAIFMAEAKLKIKYSIDVKKIDRENRANNR